MRLQFAVFLAFFVPLCAAAQTTVKLWPGAPPGTEEWQQQEQTIADTPAGTIVINVTEPTLEAWLPKKGQANGVGVIVIPGGGFRALTIGLEGREVALWLRERGIAAFVLKYRIPENQGKFPDDFDVAAKPGIADALRALAVVRRRAGEWGVAPGKLGVLGFSAGAMVASGALLQADAAARPDFAGLVYGAPLGAMPAVPERLPPVFMAWAQDDGMASGFIERFHEALKAAGARLEAHVYATGGHGFALKRQGTGSDRWAEDFHQWLVETVPRRRPVEEVR